MHILEGIYIHIQFYTLELIMLYIKVYGKHGKQLIIQTMVDNKS